MNDIEKSSVREPEESTKPESVPGLRRVGTERLVRDDTFTGHMSPPDVSAVY